MAEEKSMKKNDLIAIFILASIFVLMTILLYAYENYPLDDDWSYIWAVKNLFLTGQLRFTDWTAPTLVSQVWGGWIFSHLFGFSFESVRLSTLVISFIGIVFFYLLLRELGHRYSSSLCITLLLLMNPCSFPLTFTFFTDIPFLSLLIISAYLFFKGEKDNRNLFFLLGSVVSSLALLIRQNGLLITVAVFLYLVVKEKDKKRRITRGFLTIVLPLITFALFTYWLNVIHGQTAESLKHANELRENFLKPQLLLFKVFWRPFIILEFIGFSLIPFSFACLPALRNGEKGTYSLFMLLTLSGILFFLFFEHVGLFPSIYQWADGFKFAFISEYGIRGIFNILILFFKLIDFASLFSITCLVYLIIKKRAMLKTRLSAPSPLLLILGIGLFQLLFLFVTRKWYSRYFITVLPFSLILLLEGQKGEEMKKKIFFPLFFFSVLFTLVVCQDFMAWNQTRWRVGKELLQKGIPAQKISAGFPWDCWYSYEYSKSHPREIITQRGEVPWWIEELTPAVDPEYIISSSPHLISDSSNRNYFQTDQYQIYKSYDYFSLFYLMKKRVYVLKRTGRREGNFNGEAYFDFLENLPLMEVKEQGSEAIKAGTITIRETENEALIQPLNTEATFRIALPRKPCFLRVNLGGIVDHGSKEGNGILFKILIDDALIDNLEGIVGVMGAEHRNAFMKPRALFAKPRTFFIHYLQPSEQKWQEIHLDLSHFSGKVIDLTFSVTGWPHQEERSMLACWGKPLIMVESND
jgi:4-amino-4-deoxy-L-arabinose transferase-like glycosyltransferase